MEQFDLSDFCNTKAQAIDFVTRLERLSQQIYATGFNLDKSLQKQFGIQKKEKLTAFFRDNEVNIESNSMLGEFLNKIITAVNSLPVVNLTLAFEPDESVMREFCRWFIQNDKQVLLEIKVDTQLVAGAIVDYNGKHQDYSLRQIFDRIFSESITGEVNQKNVKPATQAGVQSTGK